MSQNQNSAFYYPEKNDDDSSLSPAEQANTEINKNNLKNNAIIDLTQGKIKNITNYNYLEEFISVKKKNVDSYYMNQDSNGRTLNVPKVLPPGVVPNASYNGGVTIGEECDGPHCSIPVVPTSQYYIAQNLKSANPPPNATTHFPSTHRLGNNSDVNPYISNYQGTKLNYGPFNISVVKFSK